MSREMLRGVVVAIFDTLESHYQGRPFIRMAIQTVESLILAMLDDNRSDEVLYRVNGKK